MGKITESIFNGKKYIIPMADVQHIEKDNRKGYEDNIIIVMKSTKWDIETSHWDSTIYLQNKEAKKFLEAWCHYRYELDIKE